MKKTQKIIFLSVLFICFLISTSIFSGDAPSLTGHWEGTIDIPGMKLDVNLDFSQKEDGSWVGNISIPAQNAKDLPLVNIQVSGLEVTFAISGIPGDPTFKGTLSKDGSKITGDFTQSGQTFPFSLQGKVSPVAAAREGLKGFDDVVEKSLETFMVPGLAMAIVKDNEVIFARGFGYRNVKKKAPMTPDTLLAIGSSSKAFTTFALGILVDEGKLEWNKPVRNYIPWFRLLDASVGDRLTPRDLVTHRSGMPRHDLIWYNNYTASREEFVKRLAHLQLTADLRERFQYNNLMFLTAGYLVEVLTEKKWEDAVQTLVFKPLGMERTNFSVEDSQKDSDFALPYREKDDKIEQIPFRNISNIGPAGSINSSVNEMANWLIVHLNNGKFKGKQIINEVTLQDMHLTHMPIGGTSTRPEISPADYGMGWFVDNYRGFRRVHHGGNIDGFSAMVSMLPQHGIGFVVLANKNGTGVPELLIRHAIDRLLHLDPIDWLGEAAEKRAKGKEVSKKAEEKKLTRRIPGTTPAHNLSEYAGAYFHPGYGDLKVTFNKDKLSLTYNGITTPLSHWHYETFNCDEAEDPTFEDMKLTFRTDVSGNVAELVAPFEPSTDEIVFEKKPNAKFYDPEYLKQFVGKYKLVDDLLTVSMKGDSLTIYVPGQPIFDLVPTLGDEFYLKQYKIVNIRFLTDKKGEVTGMELIQPNGIFETERIKE